MAITDAEYAPLVWLKAVLEERDDKSLARLEKYLGEKLGYGKPEGVNLIIDKFHPSTEGYCKISVRYKAYWGGSEDRAPEDVGRKEVLIVSRELYGALCPGITRTKRGSIIIKKRFLYPK